MSPYDMRDDIDACLHDISAIHAKIDRFEARITRLQRTLDRLEDDMRDIEHVCTAQAYLRSALLSDPE